MNFKFIHLLKVQIEIIQLYLDFQLLEHLDIFQNNH